MGMSHMCPAPRTPEFPPQHSFTVSMHGDLVRVEIRPWQCELLEQMLNTAFHRVLSDSFLRAGSRLD